MNCNQAHSSWAGGAVGACGCTSLLYPQSSFAQDLVRPFFVVFSNKKDELHRGQCSVTGLSQ